uniref:Major facilitator superfamily (MFS) profile domain-containing protein n=1 Tax=Aegilops tauschii subsp. strangulata TaxID=200361 RepID=A0A453ILL9_AEGTS
MDDFLREFFPAVLRRKNQDKESNYCKYDNQGLQLFTSSLYLAGLTATFFASYTTRRLGRRLTMLIAGVFFIIGVIFNGAAQNLAMLIIGRILLGCGVGFANQAWTKITSERGAFSIENAKNLCARQHACVPELSSSRSPVPVGDRADEDPRRAQHPVPAERDHRHPVREPGELRHEQDPPVGLAAVAVAGRHPGGDAHPGRALRHRHPQQPHRARPPGGGQGGAQADPRHRQRGAGVQRDRGGEPHRAGGEAPVPEPAPAPEPPAAGHRRAAPDLPAVHGDQRHHVLRPRAVQHARVQERRVALLGGDHGRRQRAGHAGVGVRRGPRRAARAAAGGWRADVPVAGGDRRGAGHQGDGQVGQPGPRVGHPGGGHGVHLRGLLRLVLGPAGVAHPQRDVPAGDAVGGAERDGVRQPALHLPHRAGLPLHALPPQVRHLHLLLGLGARHVRLRALLPPGDQERAHRGDDRQGVEAALVLEEIHGRRRPPPQHRQRQERHRLKSVA